MGIAEDIDAANAERARAVEAAETLVAKALPGEREQLQEIAVRLIDGG